MRVDSVDLYMHSSIDMVAVRIPRNTLSMAVTRLRCFLVCVCVRGWGLALDVPVSH